MAVGGGALAGFVRVIATAFVGRENRDTDFSPRDRRRWPSEHESSRIENLLPADTTLACMKEVSEIEIYT